MKDPLRFNMRSTDIAESDAIRLPAELRLWEHEENTRAVVNLEMQEL